MKNKQLEKNWFTNLGKQNEDLATLMPSRKPLVPPPAEATAIPPFEGISRMPLLTRGQAADVMDCSLSFLDKQIRERMIFPQPKGRHIMIPIEEIENYRQRSRLRYMERHA